MPSLASRPATYQSSAFFVEIEGIDHAGFSECSGLQVSTEVVEVKEGGLNEYAHKLPGRSTYGNVTLKWGTTDSTLLWEWYQNVIRGQVERKNVSIVLYNSIQEEVRRWNLREAYPVKWTGPAFNAGTPAVSIETLELALHGFEEQ